MKDGQKNRHCICQISSNLIILKPDINYSFCPYCGNLFIKSPSGNINYTLKPKQKKITTEFDPIKIIRAMKKKRQKKIILLLIKNIIFLMMKNIIKILYLIQSIYI